MCTLKHVILWCIDESILQLSPNSKITTYHLTLFKMGEKILINGITQTFYRTVINSDHFTIIF